MQSSYGLGDDAAAVIWLAQAQGICTQPVPEELSTWGDEDGYSMAYAVLPLTAGGALVGSARCRTFRFPTCQPRELVGELAMVDLGDKLRRYRQGSFRPVGETELVKLRERTAGWIREGMLIPPTAEKQSYQSTVW